MPSNEQQYVLDCQPVAHIHCQLALAVSGGSWSHAIICVVVNNTLSGTGTRGRIAFLLLCFYACKHRPIKIAQQLLRELVTSSV